MLNAAPPQENTVTAKAPVTLAIVGCGQRGKIYASYALAHPEACKVVAFAEPRPRTREQFAARFAIPADRVFERWEDLLRANAAGGQRIADAVVIAVQDSLHYAVVSAFAQAGLDILCEKPMATRIADCIRMADAVRDARIIFGCGHVMRYSPYVQEISAIVFSGALGELVNVVHVEPVGYFHFAHSYVRGNWASEKASTFSLMAKSCHDIDLLCHWFKGQSPVRVSSFGSLSHFRKAGKPARAGAATRCLSCPGERECAYSAKKIYLDPVSQGNTGWPADTITDGPPDIENVTDALNNTAYGLCVYESANDVVDHQVVNIEFSSGATASFTMVAFTSLICQRQTRMHFTRGEIVGDGLTFTVTDFANGTSKLHTPPDHGGGHGGGDRGISEAFVKAVAEQRQDALGTDVDEVLKSHLTVFAAEKSRRDGQVVDCAAFERSMREKVAAGQDVTL